MARAPDLYVLPKPRKVTFHGGTVSRTNLRGVAISRGLPASLQRHIRDFAADSGFEVTSKDRASVLIRTAERTRELPTEGYFLEVGDRVVLEAPDPRGLFYGLQALK